MYILCTLPQTLAMCSQNTQTDSQPQLATEVSHQPARHYLASHPFVSYEPPNVQQCMKIQAETTKCRQRDSLACSSQTLIYLNTYSANGLTISTALKRCVLRPWNAERVEQFEFCQHGQFESPPSSIQQIATLQLMYRLCANRKSSQSGEPIAIAAK